MSELVDSVLKMGKVHIRYVVAYEENNGCCDQIKYKFFETKQEMFDFIDKEGLHHFEFAVKISEVYESKPIEIVTKREFRTYQI